MKVLTNEEFLPFAIQLIDSAKESIIISTFKAEMTTKPRGRRLMKLFDLVHKKAREGITVSFLISERENYGHIPLTNFYAVRELKANSVKVRHLKHGRLCHTKLIIVDNETAILGSHNLGIKSCHNNYEMSLYIDDPHIVAQMEEVFNVEWENAKKD